MSGPAPAGSARVEAFGDAAILITLPGEVGVELAARAQALARRIRAAGSARDGLGSVVPAAASVLVQLDPRSLDVAAALRILEALAAEWHPKDAEWPADAPRVEIPVRYGGDDGPDLGAVAAAIGLTEPQVVEAHASVDYRALFLGFAPGFAYLGPLPPELVVPRRATPRVRVPAGSVAIAGPYTAVYPIDSPGGWHLIGSTREWPWRPDAPPASWPDAGWVVRFVPERP